MFCCRKSPDIDDKTPKNHNVQFLSEYIIQFSKKQFDIFNRLSQLLRCPLSEWIKTYKNKRRLFYSSNMEIVDVTLTYEYHSSRLG